MPKLSLSHPYRDCVFVVKIAFMNDADWSCLIATDICILVSMEKQHVGQMRFIQSRLPSETYEWLRLRGFLLRQSMNSIVLEAVVEYRVAIDGGEVAPAKESPSDDTVVKYNVRVEDDLYEWLRTTAFYARLSINTLLIAALARFRERRKGDEPATHPPH